MTTTTFFSLSARRARLCICASRCISSVLLCCPCNHIVFRSVYAILDSFDMYYLCLCVNLNPRCRLCISSYYFVTSHYTLAFFCCRGRRRRCSFLHTRDQVSECVCMRSKPCTWRARAHTKFKCTTRC